MNVVSFRGFLKPSCSVCEFKLLPCMMGCIIIMITIIIVVR